MFINYNNRNEQNVCLYRGLRVRMGLHAGIPHCEQDQITFRTEYFGPVVNTAARIVSHAVGGQIVASSEVYKLVATNLGKLEPCVVEQVGTIPVKNSEPLALYQVSFYSLACLFCRELTLNIRYGLRH